MATLSLLYSLYVNTVNGDSTFEQVVPRNKTFVSATSRFIVSHPVLFMLAVSVSVFVYWRIRYVWLEHPLTC